MGAAKGASSFYNTIKHYIDCGCRVDLVIGSDVTGIAFDELGIYQWHPRLLRKFNSSRVVGFIARVLFLLSFSVFAVITGRRLIQDARRTIIYAYEIHGVPAGWLLGSLFQVPLVTRFQGTILAPKLKERFWRLRYFDHFLAMRAPASLTIMANDGTLGDVVINHIRQHANLRFWINGVNLSKQLLNSSPYSSPAREDTFPFSLLTSSRLVQWKRVDRIIRALPAIRRSLPNTSLTVLGDGPEMARLARLAHDLNVADSVRFTGAIPQQAISSYYTSSDLFVTLFDLSNVGNPLLEAMWLGVPILTLAVGGTSTIVAHGHNGVLVPIHRLDDLPNEIISLLRDHQRRNALALGAKEYAKTNLDDWTARMSREAHEVFRLLQGSQRPSPRNRHATVRN